MKTNINVFEQINSQKQYIYSILILSAGLLLGVILFKYSNESFHKAVAELFKIGETSFTNGLINHFCLYFSVYVTTVLLGLCLIGFPVLSIIPIIVGFELGIKLSFFFTAYSVKGIGYSVLMIIPEASAFITILLFTISKSNSLSKNIFSTISKKEGTTEDIVLKSYLKSFLLYGLIITLISLINSTCSYFLSSIISI